jgi:type 2A phosphatase activator TIP41
VEETGEGIDYSRLKQQETIHFYDDVILYEDELADNGTALLSAKIRVMVSGFYLLLRFFLRVDGVVVRLNDTRIYHQAGTNFLTREYCSKEARISDLRVSTAVLTDPEKLNNILPVKHSVLHRLMLPQ